ncbi:MAG: GTP-binding protein, partial [Lachnospiraceae bacterium]|nr:GTP-binding protein [Lachnospiraceae bacterium]
MIKVDIVSGFLGAGKTTLISELLRGALKGEQVVLIENEFGEIGIDGGFLKDAGIEIREMNSGCICCSLVGDFGSALSEVAKTYKPDRIIIEPSGVGKLSDVIHAIEKVKDEVDLVINSAVTVVDVLKCRMYLKNFGEFFSNQVETAGTVILSRTDTPKATDEKVEQAVELIRGLNPDATIITTPVTELGGDKVMKTIEGVKIDLTKLPEEHEHHHHHDHDHEEHEHHHEHDENCECGCHDHDHDH